MIPILVAAAVSLAAAVQGRVVDPSFLALAHAQVRLQQEPARKTLYRAETNANGDFHFADVAPGNYTLRATMNGFREKAVDIAVREDDVNEVGNLLLRVLGCDAPGVSCDPAVSASSRPEPRPLVAKDAALKRGCVVDLVTASVHCGEQAGDLRLTNDADGFVYLVPEHGATIKAGACERGAYEAERVRIDGLGIGNDWCVRRNDQSQSHVFLQPPEVEANAAEITLWIVTRK